MTYYKILNKGKSCNGGNASWSLPVKQDDGTWTPGEWMPEIVGTIVLCENGYHLCRPQDLIYWINQEIYEAECGDEIIEDDNKVVVRKCRLLRKVETWNDKTLRLFACWCVRQVWHLLNDERSKKAIEVAEEFADGKATQEELDAAWVAAARAARAAAAADAARAAAEAARAARAAARDAQNRKLLEMIGE